MNCVELQASLAEIEDGRSTEQRDHLKTCPECSALVAELMLIASTAVELRAARRTQSPRLEVHRNCTAAGGPDSPPACEPFPSAFAE